MLQRISKWLSGAKPAKIEAPAAPQVAAEALVSSFVDPGAPYVNGEPVPRWPEHGAALVVVPPEALLETQRETIRKIRGFCPLTPQKFEELVEPVFLRYAEWVHLLPASESHHHYGPGGLLRHGFEVALHAARIGDGKQVGTNLSPSERAQFAPRWKVATMLGGLCHDLGKPLSDCGATDSNRQMTWPRTNASLYQWLTANKLTHYRFHWRTGDRHERHKPLGTAVLREILGQEMLDWLSEDPTQEVMDLLMMSIAQGRSAGNLMSVIISHADSLSVEEDLKQLAKRTQGSGQGGNQSSSALIMAELRRMVEGNKLEINKPGGALWVTSEGTFGLFPAVINKIKPELDKKQINGLPASPLDYAQLLADTGFIEPATGDGPDSKEYSNKWVLTVELTHKGVTVTPPPFDVVRFVDPALVFGNMPLPTTVNATVRPPFATAEDIKKAEESVVVASAPQSAESALGAKPGVPVDAQASAPSPEHPGQAGAEDAPPLPRPVEEEKDPLAPDDTVAPPLPHIENRRNRRDLATQNSIEHQKRRELKEAARDRDIPGMLDRLESSGLGGPAVAGVLRRICGGKIVWNEGATETMDGLVVKYPVGLAGLGMPEADLLAFAGSKGWLVVDAGSDRKVTERPFPKGGSTKCVIFTGLVLRVWQAIRDEHPEVLQGATVKLPGDEMIVEEEAPPPRRRAQNAAPAERQHPTDGQPSQSRPERPSRPAQSQGTTPPAPAPTRPEPKKSHQAQARGTQERAQVKQPPRQVASQPAAPERQRQGPAPGTAGMRVRTAEEGRPVAARTPIGKAPPPPPPRVAAAPAADPKPAPRESAPAHDPEIHGPTAAMLVTATIAELNEQKIGWINACVYGVLMRGKKEKELELEELTPEWIIRTVSLYAEHSKIRMAPLIKALATQDNPALIFKEPASMDLKDVKKIKLNPEFAPPKWMLEIARRQGLELPTIGGSK